jgi:hypothetical protein
MRRMAEAMKTTRFRFWLWLTRAIGVIVPQRLRADGRQEWEVELRYWERLSEAMAGILNPAEKESEI